ncbi:MAG: hypothetical protein IJE79_02505 [Alphaproteobacteria bacterium]|nr:hypothetical protein [Alphaproteobacteria bacterium]
MKKIALVLPVLFFGTFCNAAQSLPQHLICKTALSEYDPNVKESYDVRITEYANGIVLNIDNESFVLIKMIAKDGTVYYYSETPWYNFRIDNDPQMASKYNLGIPTNEPFARYTSCREVE